MSLEDAINIARVDEHYQQSKNGFVEGAHDFDKINTLTTLAAARAVVNLTMLRDFWLIFFLFMQQKTDVLSIVFNDKV